MSYLRYTPASQNQLSNSGASQRIIRMVEVQKDPLEPPKFKINKKIPKGPPSPPAPIMHSPPRKVTVKEQQDWKIPPCIPNWKNPKGYTIPLDKRLAADGNVAQHFYSGQKYMKLNESLFIAEKKAREAIEMRAQLERKKAQKEKEEKEETLRNLAQKARQERAGIRNYNSSDEEDVKERNQLRHERNRERQRDRNIARAAPEKASRLERERDISEEIALGLANPKANSKEIQFDQRLFNQNKGLGSGFGDDEEYNVYDKPWKKQNNLSGNLYKFTKKDDDKEEDFDSLKTSTKFVSEKSSAASDKGNKRSGPVEFEKHDDDDPFGLDKFLTEAKKASKKPKTSSSRHH